MSAGAVAVDSLAALRHDLRTPINHILGYSEMLAEDAEMSGNAGAVKDLRRIRDAAQRMLGIVQERLVPGWPPGETGRPHATALPGAPAWASPAPLDWSGVAGTLTGHVLVVDDDAGNRELLARHLERLGLRVSVAHDGAEALDRVAELGSGLDAVLLDVMMPGMDGTGVLGRLKSADATRHLPVIMVSGWDELGGVARCIALGAEDFLAKPFEPLLLRARMGASLEKKALRDAEQRLLRAIQETQRRLDAELRQARDYVASTLPQPMDGRVRLDWLHVPSTELGGDALGYHWIDEDHLAVYLLDVCGHGVGASLMAVAAINVLRSGSLRGTDFRDAGAVLTGMNEAFPMERHNDMYMTLWYGVYQVNAGVLRHACGGHPPALLVRPRPDGGWEGQRLRVPGPIVGVMPGLRYDSATVDVPAGSRLFVVCDGCFEIRGPTGEMGAYGGMEAYLRGRAGDEGVLDGLLAWARAARGEEALEDDFSVVRCCFGP